MYNDWNRNADARTHESQLHDGNLYYISRGQGRRHKSTKEQRRLNLTDILLILQNIFKNSQSHNKKVKVILRYRDVKEICIKLSKPL